MRTYSSVPPEQEGREIISCPVCGEAEFHPRWTLGRSSFVTCNNCSLLYQNPQPVFTDLKERYDVDYYQYEIENQESFVQLMLSGLRDLHFPTEKGEGRRFLDVGCATGALLGRLKEWGWDPQGIEICKPSATYAIEKRNIPVFIGTLEEWDAPDETLDVFHSSHVIEHLVDPRGFVRRAYRLLKKGGRFLCTTPNISGWQAHLFKDKWRSLIEDHLCLFQKKQLIKLMREEGFEIQGSSTWGGLAQGAGPKWLKKILDPAAKALGGGDVMIIEGIKPL